jgi:hypothetical protein
MTQEEFNEKNVIDKLSEWDLNWEVLKEPLVIVGEQNPVMGWLKGESNVESTPFFATVRSDNRTKFASVSGVYEIFQNKELMELAIRVSNEIDVKVHKAGMFKDGAHVFIQLDLGSIQVGRDTITRYLTVLNSHDKTGSLRWGIVGETLSCENQYSNFHGSMYSVRHTTNMRQIVDESIELIQKLETVDIQMMNDLQRFADIRIDEEILRKVIMSVTDVDIDTPPQQAKKQFTPQAINKTEDLLECLRSEMVEKGHTLWGLMSGVTYYTTHVAGNDKSREASKMFGALQVVDQKAFEIIKKYADEQE